MRVPLLFACMFIASGVACAQTPRIAASRNQNHNNEGPWFGVHLPPKIKSDPAVIVGDRVSRPVAFPANEKRDAVLAASAIRKDLETIVGFSQESHASREIGSGQLWGRLSGFPSGAKTIDWAAEQFRQAGIETVKIQSIEQEANASFWLPLSWEVRLLGDVAFGENSNDIVLESAMPLPPSMLPNGTLTAPLVYVGGANQSIVDHIDVQGKIAVQLTVPQGHMLFERESVTARAQYLMKRGALAVLNLVRLPGNELSHDFSNCGGPCFNLGGRDGLFVESILDRATQSGLQDKVRAQITLKTQTFNNLKAQNAVAVIKGRKSDETIIVDAHADAWFDGAGDNADGLAVMIGLARHFAKPANRPERTLVFIASAGHHSPGINGPRNFVLANPELAGKAVIAINIEHVAQRNFSAARSVTEDGYRQAVADSGEAPIVIGISNRAPFLDALAQQGVSRFGANFSSEKSSMQSGETGGFADLKIAKITVMQAAPLYHTSGEGLDVISTPGLERIAHFFAYFIQAIDKAPRAQLNP